MKYYVLKEISEGLVRTEVEFKNFEELKAYLLRETSAWFEWVNDNVEDPKYYRELPDFTGVENVRDVEVILKDYDYEYWKIEVEEVNKFTNLLKVKRQALGLTQTQVSEALGFNPKYYQQIELGINLPSFDTFLKLSDILKIDIGDLEKIK